MPSVAEIVALVEKAGLVVQKNPSKHSHTMWDIIDPKSGTILTGISGHADKQGGDHNWHFNIRRVLRKAGFQIEFGGEKKKKNRKGYKQKPAIDLDALKKAQDQAIAAGHRPPLLEDIEGDRSFLTQSIGAGKITSYSEEATGEVIDDMPTGTDSPRVYATVERLKKCLDLRGPELSKRAEKRQIEKHGDLRGFRPGGGVNAEFVRIAIEEVAPQRGLRAWTSEGSGQQTMYTILKAEKPGMALWTLQLIEATMDHLDGLKWNEIDPDKIKKATQLLDPPPFAPKEETETSTPPQEGPDQTTYDVALQLVDEYEEVLREVSARAAGPMNPAEWQGIPDKSAHVKRAVELLREDYNDLQLKYQATEQTLMNQSDGDMSIKGVYADVLLELLKNFEADKQGNAMLDLIFTRLDKLAGI